jgi:ribosome-associated protein
MANVPELPAGLAAFVTERFVRSSGPGGQNVNKVATAVELRFDLSASSLSDEVKTRLRDLAGHRLAADGSVIIDAREYRTQTQNREAARARLMTLVQQASRRPKKRRATKPTASARERRLSEKQRRGSVKKTRQRGGDLD